jgi:hypothetical protein
MQRMRFETGPDPPANRDAGDGGASSGTVARRDQPRLVGQDDRLDAIA